MFKAQQFSHHLQTQLPFGYRSYDWTYRHANLFEAIKMEKTVMFVILALIVAVAALWLCANFCRESPETWIRNQIAYVRSVLLYRDGRVFPRSYP
jgi:hypothetical protein